MCTPLASISLKDFLVDLRNLISCHIKGLRDFKKLERRKLRWDLSSLSFENGQSPFNITICQAGSMVDSDQRLMPQKIRIIIKNQEILEGPIFGPKITFKPFLNL